MNMKNGAKEFFREFLKVYFINHDINSILDYFSPQISLIINNKAINVSDVSYLKQLLLSFIDANYITQRYEILSQIPISTSTCYFNVNVKNFDERNVLVDSYNCVVSLISNSLDEWKINFINLPIYDEFNMKKEFNDSNAFYAYFDQKNKNDFNIVNGGHVNFFIDEKLSIEDVDKKLLSFLKYDSKKNILEKMNNSFLNLVHKDDREFFLRSIEVAILNYFIVFRILDSKGESKRVCILGSKIGNHISGICLDPKSNETFIKNIREYFNKKNGSDYNSTLYDSNLNDFQFILENGSFIPYKMPNHKIPHFLIDYPNYTLDRKLIHPLDEKVFIENFEKFKTGKEKIIEFEVRFRYGLEHYLWYRTICSYLYSDKLGKDIVRIKVFCVDKEIKENIKYRLNVERRKAFGDNYIAYLTFDVESYKIIEHEPFSFPMQTLPEGTGVDLFISNLSSFIVEEESRKQITKMLDRDYLLNAYEKYVVPFIEYRRYSEDRKKYIWVNTRINLYKTPYTKRIVAFVSTYDITEKKEKDIFLNNLIKKKNDFILRLDFLTNYCTVFASKDNILNFEEGLSHYSFEEIDTLFSEYPILGKNKKGLNYTCSQIYPRLKNDKEIINLVDVEKNDQTCIYRSTIFQVDNYNSVIVSVDDITSIIKKERSNQLKLEKAVKAADFANQAKMDFFARMSHDMRTPMTTIIGLASLGLEECKDPCSVGYFNQIKDSSEYLLELVNDILEIQMIEKCDLVLNPGIIQFNETIIKIKNLVSSLVKNKDINLECIINYNSEDSFYGVDERRLEQVLVNILTNAIKYTPAKGKIYWENNLFKESSGSYVMSFIIRDNGVGMSKTFQKHMYDSFSKERNEFSAKEGGSGLGLSITKRIIDAMKGSIKCNSNLGQGTEFFITIPISIQSNDKKQIDKSFLPINFKCMENKTVLVCEDNVINASIIEKILLSKKINVILAENGQIGLKKFKDNKIDLILMDIRMPIMDGFATTKEIRKIDSNVPIIALSANAYNEDIALSLNSGMNLHLSKPVSKNDLFKAIYKVLIEDCYST